MLKKERVVNPHTFKKMSMTVAGTTTMAKSTSSNGDSAYSSGDSEPRTSSTDVNSIAPRKIYDLLQNPEVPLRQPGNCLNTDSLLRTADELLMQLLLSQAINDSKGFKALDLLDVEECKKNLKFVQSRTQSLKTRMLLEAKVRDAAYALTQLHASNKKMAKQAHEQLAAANEKVDEVATEVWKLTQQGWELHKRILEHDVAVLSVGITKLEQEKVELNSKWKSLQSGNKSLRNSPEPPRPEPILKPNPSILYSSTIQDNEATSLQLTIAQIQVDKMKRQVSHKDFEIQQLKEKIDAVKSQKSSSQEDNHKLKQAQLNQKLEALSHQLDSAHNTIQKLEEKKEEQFNILVKNINKEWEDKVQELKDEKNQWKNLAERQQKTTEELDNRIHQLMDKLERVSLKSNSEDDDNDQDLMRQLQRATEELENVSEKYEDTSSVLTRLFDILPEPHPSVMPFPIEPNEEFNLENFEEKVEGLIKENSDLIDKVIALQKQNEDLHGAVQAIAEKHTKWN